jgi:hypothetical protein
VDRAGEFVEGVAPQARQAASNLYEQGARSGAYVREYAAQEPVVAMLIAGVSGRRRRRWSGATRYQAEQDAAPLLEICLDDVTEGGAIAQTAVFVPRHALALEIKEVIESNLAARGRPVAVQILRGRDHRAEHYEAPCQRWREAGELGRKGLPVYRQLARTNVEHAEVLEAEIVACRHGRPCSFLSSTV